MSALAKDLSHGSLEFQPKPRRPPESAPAANSCATAYLPYALLRANASQIPLQDNSASLVLATPPDFGQKRFYQGEFCTKDSEEYDRMMRLFLAEATRIVKPNGHILLCTRDHMRPKLKIFRVLQKRLCKRQWKIVDLKSRVFHERYVKIKNFYWRALPISVYRRLVSQFSNKGDTVVHVFAGSGNGGLAALELERRPVLIDLHYQGLVRHRLNLFLRRIGQL